MSLLSILLYSTLASAATIGARDYGYGASPAAVETDSWTQAFSAQHHAGAAEVATDAAGDTIGESKFEDDSVAAYAHHDGSAAVTKRDGPSITEAYQTGWEAGYAAHHRQEFSTSMTDNVGDHIGNDWVDETDVSAQAAQAAQGYAQAQAGSPQPSSPPQEPSYYKQKKSIIQDESDAEGAARGFEAGHLEGDFHSMTTAGGVSDTDGAIEENAEAGSEAEEAAHNVRVRVTMAPSNYE